MMRWIGTFIIMLSMTGCDTAQQRPWDTLTECQREKTDLTLHVRQLENTNAKLTEQLQTVLKLNPDVRLEAVNTLQTIRIGKRSGFFDTNDDGAADTLIVYLEPKDTVQDTIKAPGQVTIELWDLDAAADEAKPAQWIIPPDQLHTAWGRTIFKSHYRLTCPLENLSTQAKDYTVKATFTDYLSGKILTDQAVIAP